MLGGSAAYMRAHIFGPLVNKTCPFPSYTAWSAVPIYGYDHEFAPIMRSTGLSTSGLVERLHTILP